MSSEAPKDIQVHEFHFLKAFLENVNIPVSILDTSALAEPKIETLQLFSYFIPRESIERYLAHVFSSYDRHTLYKLDSMLLTQYYLFFLPGEKVRFVLVGPFCEKKLTEEAIRRNMELCRTPASRYDDLICYYNTIREVDEPQILQTLLTTFCERLYGGMDQFRMEKRILRTRIPSKAIWIRASHRRRSPMLTACAAWTFSHPGIPSKIR